MKQLPELIAELEANIVKAGKVKTSISAGSIGWHIEHSLLVVTKVAETLSTSDPGAYKKRFSIWKTIVFATNKIPRGKAKSPARVVPKGATKEAMTGLLAATTEKLAMISALPANHWFKHPVFGSLNVEQALRFLTIHTNHHVEIIRDIVAAD